MKAGKKISTPQTQKYSKIKYKLNKTNHRKLCDFGHISSYGTIKLSVIFTKKNIN